MRMKKVIFEKQKEVFERVIRNRSGQLFRVRFVVIERDGVSRGKIISCEQIHALRTVKSVRKYENGIRVCGIYSPFVEGSTGGNREKAFYLLEGVRDTNTPIVVRKLGAIIESPYFNKFSFLSPIKIRAPSR